MRAAAIQMNSTADKQRNLATAERLVRAAVADGSTLVVLPEKFNVLGTHEQLLDGCSFYREIAEHGLADSVFLQRDLEEREEVARL